MNGFEIRRALRLALMYSSITMLSFRSALSSLTEIQPAIMHIWLLTRLSSPSLKKNIAIFHSGFAPPTTMERE